MISAFEKSYPTAKVKGYLKEKEGRKITYEIDCMVGTVHHDVSYSADGSLVFITCGLLNEITVENLKERIHMKTVQNFARIGVVTLTVFACSLPVYAQKVANKDILAAITKAFKAGYPSAVIKNVSKETEDGKVLYEVESMNGASTLDIVYSPDGTALEIEEGIQQETLPDAVKAAVQKAYPKGKIKTAEKLTRGTLSGFEITIAVGKKVTAMALDANGNVIKSAAEDEKAETAKDKAKK